MKSGIWSWCALIPVVFSWPISVIVTFSYRYSTQCPSSSNLLLMLQVRAGHGGQRCEGAQGRWPRVVRECCRHWARRQTRLYVDMCAGTRAGMCAGMWVGMCAGMRVCIAATHRLVNFSVNTACRCVCRHAARAG